MQCKDCKHLMNLKNTEECNQGICSYSSSYFPIDINSECAFLPKELTCKDCDRFGEDYACLTVEADDSVYQNGELCFGYIDKYESTVIEALMTWRLRGWDWEEKINDIINQVKERQLPAIPKEE